MNIILGGLLGGALIALCVVTGLWFAERVKHAKSRKLWTVEHERLTAEIRREEAAVRKAASMLQDAEGRCARLAKWSHVADADEMAQRISVEAKAMRASAEREAKDIMERAHRAFAERVKAAETQAEQIAGEAYESLRNVKQHEQTVRAMKNIIEGYGDEYLVPAESLLDDLAEAFSHKDAGQRLKMARDLTKRLIKERLAARCEYADEDRRERAEEFVLDAFNGKVDSVLSRVKHDNHGKLAQEIRDAFQIVNYGGKAFRDARITNPYLAARLDELKWGAAAQELRRREQEEQRLLREQIREEQKAQREMERAIKDASKQEDTLRAAMVQAEAKILSATEAQRAKFEEQLAELQARLAEAEEKGQRAISMAQQTKKGFVYIISNIGSFGEHIYKVGLTRRLEPLDRIRELGDSSVPFEFDVHALILSDNAPALECQLHKHFAMRQINKVNHRKEFFRAELSEIRREIEGLGIQAHWTMTAEAMQYRETLAIERKIEADPAAREAWLNRQLCLDPTDFIEAEEREAVLVGEEDE